MDQHPPADVIADLATQLFALPHVREAPSAVSVPGARALWLDRAQARGPSAAFLIGTEFAHLHPLPDGSLHVALPPAIVPEAVARGWAEIHPMARRGVVPPNVVMLYAPRDATEARLALGLMRAAHRFALGDHVAPEAGPAPRSA